MKKLIICLIFTSPLLFAQKTVDDIAAELGRGHDSDSAKVVAIYDWIRQNISYDRRFRFQLYGDTTLTQEPYNVVARRRAVCIGYAKLFRELCKLNKITAFMVEGWVKDGQGRFILTEEHAWNVVKIGNSWYAADATWDAGLGDRKYFLKDPSVFVRDHLPHDPMWQLMSAPVGFDCFSKGKNCRDTTVFNYCDSIQQWQNLDSFAQVSSQALRMYHFNPDNNWAIRRAAEAYTHLATAAFLNYYQLRQLVVEKKQKIPNARSMALAGLNTAKMNLETALEFYEKSARLLKAKGYSDANLNAELIQENLENLLLERVFVEKFFKN